MSTRTVQILRAIGALIVFIIILNLGVMIFPIVIVGFLAKVAYELGVASRWRI
jgi:hypothetical protein